jgi:hypothetical protein
MTRLLSPAFFVAVAALTVCLGAASDPPPAAALSARADACEFRHSRTVRRSRDVRIFFRTRGPVGVSGCHYDRGRAYELKGYARDREAPGSLPSAESLRISGTFAGYEVRQGRFSASRTQAINLRTGRLARDAYNGGGEQGDPALGVTDLELSRTGSIAWILAIQDTEGLRGEVRIGPRSLPLTQATTIDRGPDIDPRSLVLRGSTLYWTNAGVRRSVTLR